MSQVPTVHRAFELARSGRFATIDQLRVVLRDERCDAVCLHLAGAGIRRQLKAAMAAARTTTSST